MTGQSKTGQQQGHKEANLGQREAQQEQKSTDELRRMGERSNSADRAKDDKGGAGKQQR